MSYRTEFPAEATPPAEILALVETGILTDDSWHNDVCPHFEAILKIEVTPGEQDKVTTIQLWSDYPELERREYDEPRYRAYIHVDDSNPEDDYEACLTDDAQEAVRCVTTIIERAKTHTASNPDGGCIFNRDLRCVLCGESFPGYR